jgi:hypothetical protein
MSTLDQKSKKPRKGKRAAPSKSSASPVVDKVIEKFEEKLEKEEVKVSVGDYIRLVQLRQEMKAEEPKEVKATWVEPAEKEPATET